MRSRCNAASWLWVVNFLLLFAFFFELGAARQDSTQLHRRESESTGHILTLGAGIRDVEIANLKAALQNMQRERRKEATLANQRLLQLQATLDKEQAKVEKMSTKLAAETALRVEAQQQGGSTATKQAYPSSPAHGSTLRHSSLRARTSKHPKRIAKAAEASQPAEEETSTRTSESELAPQLQNHSTEARPAEASALNSTHAESAFPRTKAAGHDRSHDLAFVHVPSNFGQAIENVALMSNPIGMMLIDKSLKAHDKVSQRRDMVSARGPGGEIWGHMEPDLREPSASTNCPIYASPQRYWPAEKAGDYFRYNYRGNRTVFGVLRDPYDRIASLFRSKAQEAEWDAGSLKRGDSSIRRDEVERYSSYYKGCDLNGWVLEEMAKVLHGDAYRHNCSLVPQAAYFGEPHGIDLAIDAADLPRSFDELMARHGYDFKLNMDLLGNLLLGPSQKCHKTALDLNVTAMAVIKEVYMEDFTLRCKLLGHCDFTKPTCLSQIRGMCPDSLPVGTAEE